MKFNRETVSSLQNIGGVLIARKSLSSAQLLTLNTSPVEIIPAPGPDKVIIITASAYRLFFGTVPYTLPGPPALFYDGMTRGADSAVSGFEQGQDSLSFTGYGTVMTGDPALFVDKAIVFADTVADGSGGDGTAEIVVYYVIADF